LLAFYLIIFESFNKKRLEQEIIVFLTFGSFYTIKILRGFNRFFSITSRKQLLYNCVCTSKGLFFYFLEFNNICTKNVVYLNKDNKHKILTECQSNQDRILK